MQHDLNLQESDVGGASVRIDRPENGRVDHRGAEPDVSQHRVTQVVKLHGVATAPTPFGHPEPEAAQDCANCANHGDTLLWFVALDPALMIPGHGSHRLKQRGNWPRRAGCGSKDRK
jgi:hypothetical protein